MTGKTKAFGVVYTPEWIVDLVLDKTPCAGIRRRCAFATRRAAMGVFGAVGGADL